MLCQEGNGGESALVVVSSVFFSGGRGPVSFRAVKGEGDESALVVVSSSVFFRGDGASQLLPFGLPNV